MKASITCWQCESSIWLDHPNAGIRLPRRLGWRASSDILKRMGTRSRKTAHAIMVRPRLYIGESIAIGPGKIDLLRQVDVTHSISAAARALGMTYKRAWLLIDSLNQGFGRPVVETAIGGKGGGGATLTVLGKQLVECYAAIEARLNTAAQDELEALLRLTK
jgi:molybdate transport system regulatory protein